MTLRSPPTTHKQEYHVTPQTEVMFHAMAGAMGLVLESCINYPLDTLKTRYQLISHVNISRTPSIALMTTSILRSEGLLSIYRGLPMVLLMQTPRGFLKFGSNYTFQQLVHGNRTLGSSVGSEVALNCVAGLLTGIVDGVVVCPFEFVKVRMQSADYAKVYGNTLSALYHTAWQQGIRCMFRGMELTIWRNALWHAVYFGFMGRQKKSADRFGHSKLTGFMYGCVGGAAGSLFCSPFDVAKSRLQNVSMESGRPWALQCVYQVYRAEGFLALYRGFAPSLLRLGFGGGILMWSFEYSLVGIQTMHRFWHNDYP